MKCAFKHGDERDRSRDVVEKTTVVVQSTTKSPNNPCSLLAKCSRYRLVDLLRKARVNIGHRVANRQFQIRVT